MTLRTYIDHAIRDGAAFDAVICGCDVQQTFCWQPDMCITDACEAEYRPLLDAEIRILAAAPGERFSIIEICTDRLFLGDAFSQCAAGYCGPREYRRLFRAGCLRMSASLRLCASPLHLLSGITAAARVLFWYQ